WLVEEGNLFETIEGRFDGARFWYAGPDERHDPTRAAYLRQALGQRTAPDKLARPGLAPEERDAYAANFQACQATTAAGRRTLREQRLRAALAHAGAELKEWIEHKDVYAVTYEVD